MGNGIAHTFAQSGFTVKLIDVSEQSLDKEWLLLPQI
jgi:3-hydroxybutyryl-CoA dehydrogenase